MPNSVSRRNFLQKAVAAAVSGLTAKSLLGDDKKILIVGDAALESAKDIQGGFKNIPHAPRLPSGDPAVKHIRSRWVIKPVWGKAGVCGIEGKGDGAAGEVFGTDGQPGVLGIEEGGVFRIAFLLLEGFKETQIGQI